MLEGEGDFMVAEGENPNPFFNPAGIKEPIISNDAEVGNRKLVPTYLFDFQTKAGKTYTLLANEN